MAHIKAPSLSGSAHQLIGITFKASLSEMNIRYQAVRG